MHKFLLPQPIVGRSAGSATGAAFHALLAEVLAGTSSPSSKGVHACSPLS